MATDALVKSDLDTATAAVNPAATAYGHYRIIGYDGILDKIYFSDENGYLYSINPDGTGIEFIVYEPTGLSNGPTAGGVETNRGWFHDGWIYAVGNTGTCRRINVRDGGAYTLFDSADTGRSADGTKCVFVPDLGTDGVLFRCDVNDDVCRWDFGAGTDRVLYNGSGTSSIRSSIAVMPDKTNSDTSTERVWYCEGGTSGTGSTLIRVFAGSVATTTLSSTNISTGWPGTGINRIIDMRYDAENDKVYLLIEVTAGGDREIWTMDPDETPDVNTATLVGAVSTDANTPLSCIVFKYDSGYDTVAADIATLAPEVWLDAADVLDGGGATPSDGGAIASWPNKGSGADPTGVTSCTYNASTANLNSLPTVEFDGTDDFVQLADGSVTWPATFFIVMEKDNVGTNGYWFWSGSFGSSDNSIALYIPGGETLQWYNEADDTLRDLLNTSGDVPTGVGSILHVRNVTLTDFALEANAYDNAGGDNGQVNAWAVAAQPTTAGMNSPQLIGAREDTGGLPAVSRMFDGRIAEIIMFNRTLTYAEVDKVYAELKTKYAL